MPLIYRTAAIRRLVLIALSLTIILSFLSKLGAPSANDDALLIAARGKWRDGPPTAKRELIRQSNTPFNFVSRPDASSHLPIIYRDALDETRSVFYGPWTANIPGIVVSGQEFEITFHCTYPEFALCPSSYLVFFHGPARGTIPPENFSAVNWTWNEPHSYGTVTARYTIHDPGEYLVYAYPEFVWCRQWQYMRRPWNQASVQGSPFTLVVTESTPISVKETYNLCSTTHEILDGRYLSTNPGISPHQFTNEFSFLPSSPRTFSWAPYTCKIPPRQIEDVIPSIPDAQHFLFIGDSTTRGPFCAKVWETLHGTVDGSVCDYRNNSMDYWEMKWGHKFTWKTFEDEGENRNVSFSFLWLPRDFRSIEGLLLALRDPGPTHVVFNMGLWIAWEDVDSFASIYWNFLEFMKKHFSGTLQHVILRTQTSVVQAVQCYGDANRFYSANGTLTPPADSSDYRLGASRKRQVILDLACRWNQAHLRTSSFRVSVVDAWGLTDNRPETTSDGRHWILEETKSWASKARLLVGEAEDSILDWIWDDFVNERITL